MPERIPCGTLVRVPTESRNPLELPHLAPVWAMRARRDEGVWWAQMTEEQRRPRWPEPVRGGNSSEFRD